MNQIGNTLSGQATALELAELSHKTGLVVRRSDSATVDMLFDELEKYDSQGRAENFEHLKRALDETRASLGAKPAFDNE
jgi:hypothetical protein